MGTSISAPPSRPRVAILIVNGFDRKGPRGPEREAEALRCAWIELCLRQIARHSRGWDYEVFVYDNSHLKPHRAIMSAFENVRVWPPRPVAAAARVAYRLGGVRAGRLFERRHPRALDYLTRKVPPQFEYIVTLDNDSFPVREDWLERLVTACAQGAAVAGVYRDEMAPDVHPFVHVSGLCVSRRDLLELGESFGRHIDMTRGRYKQDTDFNQDVGQKITYEFKRQGRTVAPLSRSNRVNFHYVMGGVYGDVIYHHGAGGRRVSFRTARDLSFEERAEISRVLRDAAFADVDHLIEVLRGAAPNDLGLRPLEADPAVAGGAPPARESKRQ